MNRYLRYLLTPLAIVALLIVWPVCEVLLGASNHD